MFVYTSSMDAELIQIIENIIKMYIVQLQQ